MHKGYSQFWYEKLNTNLTPTWFGHTIVKHPNDLFAYQEIIAKTRPDLIIETGTYAGGSALYLAHLCDLNNKGRVLSVDLKQWVKDLPEHPRIGYLIGVSSTDKVAITYVAKAAAGKRCMVILDSSHGADHVFQEMSRYSPFVAKGCYMIVEDTNRDGYFLGVGDIIDGQGPAEAIKRWQPSNRGFEADRRFDAWGFTQNPGGFLKRVR